MTPGETLTIQPPSVDNDEELSSLGTFDVVNLAIARDDSCFSLLSGADAPGEVRPTILQQSQSLMAGLNTVFSDDNSSVGVVEGTAVAWDGNNVEVQQVWQERDDYSDDGSFETSGSSSMSWSSSSSHSFVSSGVNFDDRMVYFREVHNRKKGKRKRKCIQSSKIRISIVSIMNPEQTTKTNEPVCRSLKRPLDLLEVENGTSALVIQKPRVSKSLNAYINALAENPLSPIQFKSEVGVLGRVWRGFLRRLVVLTMDNINGDRLGCLMQRSLPFLSAFECHLLAQVIEALDKQQGIDSVLSLAFQNRIVSRIIVQAMLARHDFFVHWGDAVTRSRLLDFFIRTPFVGSIVTSFNRHFTPSSILQLFSEEGCPSIMIPLAKNPSNVTQNLTTESYRFESSSQCGLPGDDALIGAFVTQPASTLKKYGVIFTLNVLAKHWHTMLTQEFGNFAQLKQNQLNPFETLRFHLPIVLIMLSSHRGRNNFDEYILGPLITQLQHLTHSSTADAARKLVRKIDRDISYSICGGIPTILEPLRSWLEAIHTSLGKIEAEAKSVSSIIARVELGIRLGHDVMSQLSWKVPHDSVLKRSLIRYIRGQTIDKRIQESTISSALEKFPSKDKTSFVALIQNGRFAKTPTAKLLWARALTLLRREVRRKMLGDTICYLSKGKYVSWKSLEENDWCWMESGQGIDLYIFRGKNPANEKIQLVNVHSGSVRNVSGTKKNVKFREYIPVAESIVRAQKTVMAMGINHGKIFSYEAFLEFSTLRLSLRRLLVVSQMTCDILDDARLSILSEIQRANIGKDDPENIIVLGGGSAGMLAALHCLENCLATGGAMTLISKRETTVEKSHVVRLDFRWIAMLRFHCGVAFEDVFFSPWNNKSAHSNHILPMQGALDVKNLENILSGEISRLKSKGLIDVVRNAGLQIDPSSRSLTKKGKDLRNGDIIMLNVDRDGRFCDEKYPWKVVEAILKPSLRIGALLVGEKYLIYSHENQETQPFELLEVDPENLIYHFKALIEGIDDLRVFADNFPPIFPFLIHDETNQNLDKIVIQCIPKNKRNRHAQAELNMNKRSEQVFTLSMGNSHVYDTIGTHLNADEHIRLSTSKTFGIPVIRYFNHRTICLSDASKCIISSGTEQTSPNFTSYSDFTEYAMKAVSFNSFIEKRTTGVLLIDRFRSFAREIDWSNGEGTRAIRNNFGGAGSLPGVSIYEECVNYLFSKIEDYQESSLDLHELLSDSWKVVFAAALVPSGMELNSTFVAAFRVRWHEAIFNKLMTEIRRSATICDFEHDFLARKAETIDEIHCNDVYWTKFIKGLQLDHKTKESIRKSYELRLVALERACQDIIDFAAEDHARNPRVKSTFGNQAILIDQENYLFSNESFVHSLVFAAVCGTGISVFHLLGKYTADILSVTLGAWNILVTFGIVTNASRYKTRIEDVGIAYMKQNYQYLKKKIFSMMDNTAQMALSRADDPLFQNLNKCVASFQKKATSNEIRDLSKFDNAYKDVLRDCFNVEKLVLFRDTIAGSVLPNNLSIDNDIKNVLVDVYRTVDEIIFFLTYYRNLEGDRFAAKEIFCRLCAAENRFNESLSQGRVPTGLLETRKLICRDIVVLLKFMYSIFGCFQAPPSKFSTSEQDSRYLMKQMCHVSDRFQHQALQREIQDVTLLHLVFRESAMASLIIVAAFLTFTVSAIFIIVRFCFTQSLDTCAFLCAATSSVGAVLAIMYLVQRFYHVSKLVFSLTIKRRKVKTQQKRFLRMVLRVTVFQLFWTATQLVTALTALAAFALSITMTFFRFDAAIPERLPLWFMITSIITVFASTLFSVVDKYVLQYRLVADIGPFICHLFEEEILVIHRSMVMPPRNTVDPKQWQDQEAWEYTARSFLQEWRFDTVFSAERVQQILAYIWSGAMDPAGNDPLDTVFEP